MTIHSIPQLVTLSGFNARPAYRAVGASAIPADRVSSAEVPDAVSEAGKLPGEPEMNAAVTRLNRYLQDANYNLQFSIDEASGRSVIRVIDAETREVIRQFPMEEVLALSKTNMDSGGLLFDARA